MPHEKPERDLDKEFEALVARWDTPLLKDSVPPQELIPPPKSPPTPQAPPSPPAPPPGVNIWRGPTIWRPAEDAFESGPSGALPDDPADPEDSDSEDDFVPAPVHLPPQEDLHFWGIIAGLVGGALLLLWVVLTGVDRSSWWFLAGLGLFVGGFALLILRQPWERDPTDDGTRV